MINLFDHPFTITTYNAFRRRFLIGKAKLQRRNFDDYIFGLWAKNFGVALDINCLKRLDTILQKMKPRSIFEFGS
ncbi:MAG: hypothetical protein G01um101430_310 [Parcubacteria group bacterium Gr01-1014_30]|nr:MAG: hypothetical protein G01um101430_310 [Parcubacteria group bacterium Gr01-1014_30]